MKSFYVLIALIFSINIQTKCQIFKGNQEGQELFMKGTRLIEIGNYKSADSIFTLALCTFKNEHVYYNRGISKLYQTDTIGFCDDMNYAANRYFDNGAAKMFNQTCCKKVDTIYYAKNHMISDSTDYKYLEEIKYFKYLTDTLGLIHERNGKTVYYAIDYGCDENLVGVNLNTNDIIAHYSYLGSIKYYYTTPKPIKISSPTNYEQLKTRAQLFFNVKYKDFKTLAYTDKLKVYYKLYISNDGHVIDARFLGTMPEIALGEKEEEVQKDILYIAKTYPKFTPGSFNGEKVNFILIDSIEY